MTAANFDDEPNQEKRIEKLRAEVEKLGGSLSTELGMPADLEEAFLKQVLEYENAEPMTVLKLLENAGVQVPPPESLDESQLQATLWQIIERLSSLGVYLLHTNHLSDRGLYEYLQHDGLREEATLFPENPTYAYMIDLTGSGSDKDNQIYFRYYADEDYRRQWRKDWPDDVIPDHEDPPFDRDARLPQSPLEKRWISS